MKNIPLLLLMLMLVLVACAPGGDAPAVTIPLDVALTPALLPLADALRTCASQQPSIVLAVHERPAAALFDSPADLYITLGEPDPLYEFTAQIAWEQVLLISHPSIDISAWDAAFIRRQFTSVPSSQSPANVSIWLPLDGDESRRAFQHTLLQDARFTPEAFLAPNPAGMLAAVSGDPAALGLLPAAWLDASVASVELGITMPVLISSPQPPPGPALELVACLQAPLGQTALTARYQPWNPAPLATAEP